LFKQFPIYVKGNILGERPS